MSQLLPVLIILAVVTIIMIRQIGKVSQQAGDLPQTTTRDFEFYSTFSSVIQEHVRTIKQALDSSKAPSQTPFKLKNDKDESEALEILSNAIRKLVFFETAMAKQKSTTEIETELFEVLSDLEAFLIEYCEDGEELAENLREELLEAYNQLS